MTTIINLYGGPGIGKSVIARYLAARMSIAGEKVELVSEYVKSWAWEKRTIGPFDQLYFVGQQAKKEYILLGNVDWVVTDSPVALCVVYSNKYSPKKIALGIEQMCQGYYDTLQEAGHKVLNIMLTRDERPYNGEGRFETEDEAKLVDIQIRDMLTKLNFTVYEMPANAESVYGWMSRKGLALGK